MDINSSPASQNLLSVQNLRVSIEDKPVLDGIDLDIKPGQIHVIMGPNGSGKSSFAQTLMGHPRYEVTDGQVLFGSTLVNELSPDKRAKLGMFLAMQSPLEIEGLSLKHFLRYAYNAQYDGTDKQLRLKQFAHLLIEKLDMLDMDTKFAERALNVGFSGGERKRVEMLQLAVLQPKLAILDEIDSGLDIDALKVVCNTLNTVKADNPGMAVLLITHYTRILKHINADVVHVLRDGKVVRSGGPELAQELETEGYK
ncbi:MAG: Fe-S cluster assembly ATPase SufC [Epsilonproteobacteria bacterium]|nr:Fe-S cluster assembly ATPase SufC [Campylobacterota bacterium]